MPEASANRPKLVTPTPLKWHQRLAAPLIYGTFRLFSATWRCQWFDQPDLLIKESKGPVIYCIWHNRLAISMVVYHDLIRQLRPGNGLTALISASRDGGVLAKVLEYFKVQAVRGSSSRRGSQALLELTSWIERGYDVAITPDGPRGPRYQVREGAIALAQLTGAPIIPVSNNVTCKVSLRSWDRFQIPLPFARCLIRYGEPLRVPRDLTDAQREEFRLELERRLMALTVD
jgi:lysophospholipid acyltransferase (LPLAT)-like uncharacterized protein